MAKETFFFPHDYEPTSDPKIQALLGEYGGLGYGIYWRIVEMLHSAEEHKLPLKPYLFLAIAKQMQANAEQIQAIINYCIKPCELFILDDNFFRSNRVDRNIERRVEISEIRSKAGHKGAIAKQMQAIAQQNLANTSKEKKRKEKNINYIPIPTTEPKTENNEINIFRLWGDRFELTPLIADNLKLIEQDNYPIEWIIEILDYMVSNGVRSVNYLDTSLKNRRNGKNNGFKKLEEIKRKKLPSPQELEEQQRRDGKIQ